jgi:hypothetical protein
VMILLTGAERGAKGGLDRIHGRPRQGGRDVGLAEHRETLNCPAAADYSSVAPGSGLELVGQRNSAARLFSSPFSNNKGTGL